MRKEEKLDNPVWYSLSETHAPYAIDCNSAKFYNPDYCPFGAFKTVKDTSAHLMEYAKLTDTFYMVGDKPKLSDHLRIYKEISCFQMVVTDSIQVYADTNAGAIHLYKKLGFDVRRKMSFWSIMKVYYTPKMKG